MRLYGAIQKVEPQDDGTVRVHGIATSEAVDEDGEIVRADAIRAAIPNYMRFPALREMHQLSAAGTTLEAEVGEDGMTRIVAHVVDPVAVAKVKNQVYRGFSIGGRVTLREPGNSKAITGLVLNEISLVDRPANPEAVFDCWKAASRSPEDRPFNAPIQIWACNVLDHRHLAKAEALKCLENNAADQTQTQISDEPSVDRRIRLANAEFSPSDQMLMDMAYLACEECLKLGGLSAEEAQWIEQARNRLGEAGALPMDPAADDGAAEEKSAMLGMIVGLLGKEQPAGQAMMNVAHQCISQLTDGAVCGEAEKAAPRHSRQTMEKLERAHSHLVCAGAQCDTEGPGNAEQMMEGEPQYSKAALGAGASSGTAAPSSAGDVAEKTLLTQMLAQIVPTLERLSKRVDDIARTPLPPLTIAKGTVSVSKQQDRGCAGGGEVDLSPEAIASALAKLSKEEQTLTLIKASYANPIRIPGSTGER
jgi:hypothetical protein